MLHTLVRTQKKHLIQGQGNYEIASFQVFDKEGNRIWLPAHDVDYYATAALYDTLFFAEAVHATIHVFHYLMTNALAKASDMADAEKQFKKKYKDKTGVTCLR